MNLVEEIAPPTEKLSSSIDESKVIDLSQLDGEIRDDTLEILVSSGVIREDERLGFDNYLKSTNTPSGDIFPIMADLREIDYQARIEIFEKWARSMVPILKKRLPLVAFGSKLLNTTAIYEQFPEVFTCAKISKCPIIFSEDSDVIGFGTINPVAATLMMKYTSEIIKNKTGVVPFMSLVLLDMASWEKICERHFEND